MAVRTCLSSAWTSVTVLVFLVVIAFAAFVHKTPSSTLTLATARSTDERITVLWVPPYPIPDSALTPLRQLLDNHFASGDVLVSVLCGSTECVDQVLGLKRPRARAELIDLPALVVNSPFATFAAHHPYYKLRFRSDYTPALEWVIFSAITLKYPQSLFFNLHAIDRSRLDNLVEMSLAQARGPWVVVEGNDSAQHTQWTPLVAARTKLVNRKTLQSWTRELVKDVPRLPNFERITSSLDFRLRGSSVIEKMRWADATTHASSPITFHELEPHVKHDMGALRYGVFTSQTNARAIQSSDFSQEMEAFAALQYFPSVTDVIDPRQINQLKIGENQKMVVFGTGHFASSAVTWPTNDRIKVLMNSVVIEPEAQAGLEKSKAYFVRNGPIGARDSATTEWLTQLDVDHYFAGWAASLLTNPNRRNPSEKREDVVLVDVPKDFVESYLSSKILREAVTLDTRIPSPVSNSTPARFDYAYACIRALANSRLTITSSPQFAAAAAALGASVIFVETPKNAGKPTTTDAAWLYHRASVTNRSRLHNFNWQSPPANPGSSAIKRRRATQWDSFRCIQPVSNSGRTHGAIPLESLHSDELEQKWHLIQTMNELNWRNIRTIESIFFHHPDMHVIIHCPPDLVEMIRVEMAIFQESGYRVSVKEFDLSYKLARAKKVFDQNLVDRFTADLSKHANGRYWFAHSADLFRLLVIYFDGGVYTDTDVIVVKSFESFDNAAGIQDFYRDGSPILNNAVYKFSKPYNRFIKACIVEFLTNYKGSEWDYNGPGLVSRVFYAHPEFRCESGGSCEIRDMPREAFYPMRWKAVDQLCFRSTAKEDQDPILETIRNSSFAVHLNNHVTGEHEILQKGTICKTLLNDFCVLCDRQF